MCVYREEREIIARNQATGRYSAFKKIVAA
jgi:hypothetical protein